MNNADVVLGEGRKRQLPPWMMGRAIADAVPDQLNKSEETKNVNIPKEIVNVQEETNEGPSEVNPCILAGYETKRKRSQSTRVDAQESTRGKVLRALLDKDKCKRGGRKSQESAPRRRQQGKRLRRKSCEKITTPSPGEEDDSELTVEDLMSIAQEYVGSDKHMGEDTEHRPLPPREEETENQLPAIALSRNESGHLSSAALSTTTHKETFCAHKSTEILACEAAVVNPSRTGDPAQDMLNLFLGPLLNKPLHLQNKTEPMKEDQAYSYVTQKQKQNSNATEEIVPMMKKKSSLKDRVAMFLD
ncbi:hypothetical protein NMG60_11021655 [Bertholletia excelsa]